MAEFPKLRTGAVTQYPSSRSFESPTRVLRFVDGSEQRWREAAGPVRSWTLHLSLVSEEELVEIEEFFLAQQGKFGEFSFTDPGDGVVYTNCSFDSDTLRSQIFGEEWAGTTLVIRSGRPQ